MDLQSDCDVDKIAAIAIALMYLTFHGDHRAVRAWKSLDWDVLSLLHEKGWIHDPVGKAKSVAVTEEGESHGKAMFEKHFCAVER